LVLYLVLLLCHNRIVERREREFDKYARIVRVRGAGKRVTVSTIFARKSAAFSVMV
jgi:hypothetical protein